MNLETIEQRCLAHLKHCERPLVPISQLLAHLHEDEDCGLVDARDLIEFLRGHELFIVVDPAIPDKWQEQETELVAAGYGREPRVILSTRVPSTSEQSAALRTHMGTMLNALEAAMNQARTDDNPKLALQVQGMLKRARELQQRLDSSGLIEG